MKRLGFGLVETMIVIAITMTILTGGAVFVNKMNQNQEVESAKSELLSNLRLARSLAVGMKLPSGVSNTRELIYVGMKVGSTSDRLEVFAGLDDETTVPYFEKKISKNVILGIGSSIIFSAYEGKLGARVNGNVIEPVGESETRRIQIRWKGEDEVTEIEIRPNGTVK